MTKPKPLTPAFRAAAVVGMDRSLVADPRRLNIPSDPALSIAFAHGHYTATLALARKAVDLAYTAPSRKE